MRSLATWSALVALLALTALAGCNSKDKVAGNNTSGQQATRTTTATQPSAPPAPSETARRITTVELNDLLSQGKAIVVDVRNDAAFKQSHIKGAILIPSTEIANHLKELPRDKTIVTYCS
ncbi:MAG TPA: rhodanese-like domain-containing protein [Pyrinomonadaceae bacterium]